MQVSPSHDPPDGPWALLCWLGDRKEHSAVMLGLEKLLSDFFPSERKNTRTHGFFCGIKRICNSSNKVVLTGSVPRYGYGSFHHSDKSSLVLKPLEISLPRKEICLLLGCVGEHK